MLLLSIKLLEVMSYSMHKYNTLAQGSIPQKEVYWVNDSFYYWQESHGFHWIVETKRYTEPLFVAMFKQNKQFVLQKTKCV